MIWWWYDVKKVRDFLGFPFGFHDFRKFDTTPLLWQANFWIYITILGLMLGGGILAIRRKNLWTLPLMLLMGGVMAHSLFWAEPRHALMYLPLITALTVWGGNEIYLMRAKIRGYSGKHRRLVGGLGILGVMWLGLVMQSGISGLGGFKFWLNCSLWLFILYGLGKGIFFGVRYSGLQKIVAGLLVLMIWGMLIALWQPIRINLWPEAPKNDYLFPVGVTFDERQWL
jgi:hypothetical protein